MDLTQLQRAHLVAIICAPNITMGADWNKEDCLELIHRADHFVDYICEFIDEEYPPPENARG
jgi:hypothetical protein